MTGVQPLYRPRFPNINKIALCSAEASLSIPVSHTVPYSSSDLTNRPAFRAMNSRTPNSFTVRRARPEGFVKERGGEGLRRGNQQAARVVQTQQGRVSSGKITAVVPQEKPPDAVLRPLLQTNTTTDRRCKRPAGKMNASDAYDFLLSTIAAAGRSPHRFASRLAGRNPTSCGGHFCPPHEVGLSFYFSSLLGHFAGYSFDVPSQ